MDFDAADLVLLQIEVHRLHIRREASLSYRWLWSVANVIGALFSGDVGGIKFIWNIADTVNGAMALPNLVGLLLLSRIVLRETAAYP